MASFIVYYPNGTIKSNGTCPEGDVPLQTTGNPGTISILVKEKDLPEGLGKNKNLYYIKEGKLKKK